MKEYVVVRLRVVVRSKLQSRCLVSGVIVKRWKFTSFHDGTPDSVLTLEK